MQIGISTWQNTKSIHAYIFGDTFTMRFVKQASQHNPSHSFISLPSSTRLPLYTVQNQLSFRRLLSIHQRKHPSTHPTPLSSDYTATAVNPVSFCCFYCCCFFLLVFFFSTSSSSITTYSIDFSIMLFRLYIILPNIVCM